MNGNTESIMLENIETRATVLNGSHHIGGRLRKVSNLRWPELGVLYKSGLDVNRRVLVKSVQKLHPLDSHRKQLTDLVVAKAVDGGNDRRKEVVDEKLPDIVVPKSEG